MPEVAQKTRRSRSFDPNRGVEAARSRGMNTSTKVAAATISEDKPLSDQQNLFVKFWAQGESILSASHKAGYADGGTFAYRMVYMPNVLKAYNAEKERYERDSGMNRKRVIDGMLEGIEMAKMLGEPASVIGGWREIGKMCGYYEPVRIKHEVTHEGKVLLERMEQMSDEDLFRLIEERSKQMSLAAPSGETHDAEDSE